MRWGVRGSGVMVVALALVVLGTAALLYAPGNKTALKVVILLAGVLTGIAGWVRTRLPRQ